MSVVTITDVNFSTEVLAAEKPVLVYFWASWCGPCRLMSPIMDSLATQYGSHLKIVKMEVDPNPESVAKYKVEGVPALRLLKSGEVLAESEGAINKQKVEELINAHLAAV